MSVVINDKPRRQRALNWRWPFSRQITLSLGTLAVILALWWTVAALQLVSPLFYRHRDRFYKADRYCRSAGDLWTPRCGSIWRRV